MCGIAGLALRPGAAAPPGLADRFAAALAHRGPDGRGVHQAPGILLVQTRLAIIDLVTGDQPLTGPDGLAVVANGEIYNDPALRRALGPERFATGSDCEGLLPLYQDHGPAFARHLRGMVAFALWDPARRRLVLGRDPFGIKPLYVLDTPLGIAFASEPQALIAAGLCPAQERPGAAVELLQLQFTCGSDTLFAGIQRVAPGETLVIEDGRLVDRHHTPALPEPGAAAATPAPPRDPPRDPEAAVAALDRVLEESLDLHRRADVPMGLFLSGGLDSAALLTLLARLDDRPVLTFTATFPGTPQPDEAEEARQAARAAGAHHQTVPVTEADVLAHLPAMVAAVDDLAADYALIPSWMLAREAAKEVKVVLSGEGGDEMLGGYGRYRGAMRPWPFTRPLRRRGLLDGLDLLRPDAPLSPGAGPDGWRAGIARAEAAARDIGGSRLMQAQRIDCADWLPHDILAKLDRCLMAHGVEGRVPFVDPVVARFCLPLPDSLKVRGSQGKWVLRAWLERHAPATRALARKRGFTVPVGAWIAPHGARLGPLVAASPAVARLCRPDAVAALFTTPGKDTMMAAWVLLCYALWHRRHIVGQPADGDLFHCLATPEG